MIRAAKIFLQFVSLASGRLAAAVLIALGLIGLSAGGALGLNRGGSGGSGNGPDRAGSHGYGQSRNVASIPAGWRGLRRQRLAGPYPVRVVAVVDGDTFVARVAVWLGQEVVTRVRLRGVDAPEMNGRCEAESRLAREAKQVLGEFLASGAVFLRDIGTGKYAGRVIARAYVAGRPGGLLNEKPLEAGAMLLAGGYARPYRGGRRNSWCGASVSSWH